MTPAAVIDNVTCLGCGCACDDIVVALRDGRIVEARNACALGVQWFGDGEFPAGCRVDGRDVAIHEATVVAGSRLRDANRPLVYLAPGSSCETQRSAAAIADVLHAPLDSASSAASAAMLATQEHGLASATLGEIRNRADVVVFWGVDLTGRYPRFTTRYAPIPAGIHIPHGRSSRSVIALDVGGATSTADADRRIAIEPESEVATLVALEALIRATPLESSRYASLDNAAWVIARELAPMLLAGNYVAFIYDAEPDDRAARSSTRFDAFASLSQALNERTRAAAIGLRGGGNRSGADNVLVAQTGYPFAIDFSRGVPRYDPHGGSVLALLERHAVDLVLVFGDPTLMRHAVFDALSGLNGIVIGPHAMALPLGRTHVTISTGADGIHAAGTAFRMDDVPLPLRPPLEHEASASLIAGALAGIVRSSGLRL
jgi:formylmethanofuran dehydrogenase subunit B